GPRRDEGAAGPLLHPAGEGRVQRGPLLFEERLHLYLERVLGHVERQPPGAPRHDGGIAPPAHGFYMVLRPARRAPWIPFRPPVPQAGRASSLPAGAAVASRPRSQVRRTPPVSARPA